MYSMIGSSDRKTEYFPTTVSSGSRSQRFLSLSLRFCAFVALLVCLQSNGDQLSSRTTACYNLWQVGFLLVLPTSLSLSLSGSCSSFLMKQMPVIGLSVGLTYDVFFLLDPELLIFQIIMCLNSSYSDWTRKILYVNTILYHLMM